MVQVLEEKESPFQLQTSKTRLKQEENSPNRILLILDACNWNTWINAAPKNIPKILGSQAQKAHSTCCFTLPALFAYLYNNPPIGIGHGLFNKGLWIERGGEGWHNKRAGHINVNAWMPKWYQDRGYHTSLFTGNAVMAEVARDLNISKYFDHWGVMEYLKEDVFKATPRILEDFASLCLEEGDPLFSVLWLFDTHHPYSDGKKIFEPKFTNGYERRRCCVKALKYTDEEVFPAIAEALKSTGRLSKVIVFRITYSLTHGFISPSIYGMANRSSLILSLL